MAEWNINEPTFSIQVGGIILVGAYSSHLGDQLEKARYYRYYYCSRTETGND